MVTSVKPGWSKPSTILFASELPANEKAFEFAVEQAKEFKAKLNLFHAYDTLVVAASDASGIRYYDYAAAARAERQLMEPAAKRVRELGIHCETMVRPGLPADQILAYALESGADRIVMGTHSPGPIGKLLVGSVAEAVLRTAPVPVFIVGPEVVNGAYREFATRTVLCAISLHEASDALAAFAAEVAAQHNARLILHHVIRPQDRAEVLDGRTLDDIELEMQNLVPPSMRERIQLETIVVPGDPTEELLYQSRAQHADLIILGAQHASAFAAVTRQGTVYKLLAHSHCPVLTLSSVVLEACGSKLGHRQPTQEYQPGVV